jgi:hypothetical protein
LPEVRGLKRHFPPPTRHHRSSGASRRRHRHPLTERDRKKLKKYEIPELADCRQAIGSQRIDGRLPKPLVDYSMRTSAVYQRLSIFEGGLVVVESRGAGGPIRKKVIIPGDALAIYLRTISTMALAGAPRRLSKP